MCKYPIKTTARIRLSVLASKATIRMTYAVSGCLFSIRQNNESMIKKDDSASGVERCATSVNPMAFARSIVIAPNYGVGVTLATHTAISTKSATADITETSTLDDTYGTPNLWNA